MSEDEKRGVEGRACGAVERWQGGFAMRACVWSVWRCAVCARSGAERGGLATGWRGVAR